MNKTHLYFRSKAGVEVFDHRSGHQGGNEAGQGVDSHSSMKELLPPGRGSAGVAQQCPVGK